MTKTILEHNVETNEVVERPLTADELKQLEKDQAVQEARIQELVNKEAAKESAYAKLTALGLTDEEIKALGIA